MVHPNTFFVLGAVISKEVFFFKWFTIMNIFLYPVLCSVNFNQTNSKFAIPVIKGPTIAIACKIPLLEVNFKSSSIFLYEMLNKSLIGELSHAMNSVPMNNKLATPNYPWLKSLNFWINFLKPGLYLDIKDWTNGCFVSKDNETITFSFFHKKNHTNSLFTFKKQAKYQSES